MAHANNRPLTILGTMTFGQQVDEQTADAIVGSFIDAGHTHIDTANKYTDGKTEEILGRILTPSQREKIYLATKVYPQPDGGLQPESVIEQVETSLKRLKADCVDLLYLHMPDGKTPIRKTLETCQRLFGQGKFRELGLSNYAAWQVADIWHICKKEDCVLTTGYQGLYNAITRSVEPELFPSLRHFGIRFYAYNPLAGGFLTGKYKTIEKMPSDGRFALNPSYQKRYWKDTYFNALAIIRKSCESNKISMGEASLRWLYHHSLLQGSHRDGCIIGATKMTQLEENLRAGDAGKLPEIVVEAFEKAWGIAGPECPKYFRP